MALEGTIKDFGLPDIFQLIGLQRKTGVLTLKSERDTVTITFENGLVVMADSAAKRMEDRLGNVLVKQGALSKEKLDEALQTQRATLQRLGHILTTQNYISAEQLKEAIQSQISQIVFRVFRWRDGEYHFAQSDEVEYDAEFVSPMSADFIIMEGVRMVDEWPIIEKRIPSLDVVLRPVVDHALVEVWEEGGDVASILPDAAKRGTASNRVRLTRQEEQIFRRVDGTRTVQGIIDATGLAEFDVCRTLFDLLNRNLITTSGRGVEAGLAREVSRRTVFTYVGWGLAGLAGLFVASAVLVDRPPSPWAPTQVVRKAYAGLLAGVSRSRLERLDAAVLAHHLRSGAPPRTLEQVAATDMVDRAYLKDPWARPYHYSVRADGYLLSAVDDGGRPRAEALIERVLPAERP
jgi:hypothetical protein